MQQSPAVSGPSQLPRSWRALSAGHELNAVLHHSEQDHLPKDSPQHQQDTALTKALSKSC